MKVKVLAVLVILAAFIWAACTKSKYETTPKLVFKGVNGTSFTKNQIVNFDLQVTDKEGDLQDSMIFVQRVSLVCTDYSYIKGYPIPSNTQKSNLKADLSVTYIYGNPDPYNYYTLLDACSQKTDTAYFRFWIKDNAGHTSDTVESPRIALIN
ncbi:MAG TPA: hypothetical protein VHB48_19260 [Chitinophagaceae bacterium]|nr:hypothetical protein [Chitinophagaceae bacterium]